MCGDGLSLSSMLDHRFTALYRQETSGLGASNVALKKRNKIWLKGQRLVDSIRFCHKQGI